MTAGLPHRAAAVAFLPIPYRIERALQLKRRRSHRKHEHERAHGQRDPSVVRVRSGTQDRFERLGVLRAPNVTRAAGYACVRMRRDKRGHVHRSKRKSGER